MLGCHIKTHLKSQCCLQAKFVKKEKQSQDCRNDLPATPHAAVRVAMSVCVDGTGMWIGAARAFVADDVGVENDVGVAVWMYVAVPALSMTCLGMVVWVRGDVTAPSAACVGVPVWVHVAASALSTPCVGVAGRGPVRVPVLSKPCVRVGGSAPVLCVRCALRVPLTCPKTLVLSAASSLASLRQLEVVACGVGWMVSIGGVPASLRVGDDSSVFLPTAPSSKSWAAPPVPPGAIITCVFLPYLQERYVI